MFAKLGRQMIDMHVGKANNAEAVLFRHECALSMQSFLLLGKFVTCEVIELSATLRE
jgi:hypothetical protein